MAGNFVPPTQSSTLGTSDNRWAVGFFEKLAVKTLEVIGGGGEDTQPATVGWVKQNLTRLLKSALEATGMRINIGHSKAGYICFGELFGGLIVQWGEAGWNKQEKYTEVVYPISFKRSSIVIPMDVFFGNGVPPQNEIGFFVVGRDYTTNEKFRTYSYTPGIGAFTYLAIGF